MARQASKSRGRPQALSLRFDSSSPAPTSSLPPPELTQQLHLTFIRRPERAPGRNGADAVGASDRPRPLRRLTAAVAIDDGVRRERLHEAVDVAVGDRGEEPLGQSRPLFARGLKARPAGLDAAPRPACDLPAVLLSLGHDLGDLAVLVAEHVM